MVHAALELETVRGVTFAVARVVSGATPEMAAAPFEASS
jgi:hypothetical protein